MLAAVKVVQGIMENIPRGEEGAMRGLVDFVRAVCTTTTSAGSCLDVDWEAANSTASDAAFEWCHGLSDQYLGTIHALPPMPPPEPAVLLEPGQVNHLAGLDFSGMFSAAINTSNEVNSAVARIKALEVPLSFLTEFSAISGRETGDAILCWPA